MWPRTRPRRCRVRPWIRPSRAQSCSSLPCSARDTSSWVAWAIRLPAVARVNIFIVNNLAMLRCRISRPGVKSIANELSSTATGSGRSGSSPALHCYRGYARRHSCNGAGFSKGAAFPPDLAIAANFEGFPAAMLPRGRAQLRSYDSVECRLRLRGRLRKVTSLPAGL